MVVHKKKRKKREKLKVNYCFKKQHNTSPALVPCPLVPPFLRHTALPCAFWRALLVRYISCFLEPVIQNCLMLQYLEIRCVSIKHSSVHMACGWLLTRLVVKYTALFQGWMTAISSKLMVWHLFFPVDISIWWMTENGLDFSLLWSYMYCMYCNASFPPSIHPNWSYCRALRTTWMFLHVSFVFHRFTYTVLTHVDR